MAEAYALTNAVEHGLRTRATIVDMGGDGFCSNVTLCTFYFSQFQTS